MRVSPNRRAASYTSDFRSDALNLIRRGDRSFRQLAEDLGVHQWTLRDWWKKDQMSGKNQKLRRAGTAGAAGANETLEQRLHRLERENARLQRENDSLRMDREILKKAAAFFAKESE